jgi:hypothetical protein
VPRVSFPIEIINLDTVNDQKVNQSQSHIFFLKVRQFVVFTFLSQHIRLP